MVLTRLSLPFLLLIAATPLVAGKTEDMIRELQRDLAAMQQDLKNLNSKFDEKIAVISTLLQQALNESSSANKTASVIDRQLKDNIKEVQNAVAGPTAILGNKVETMSQEYSAMNENVKDLSTRMTKIDAKLNEVLSAVKTLATPVAPPPQAIVPANTPPAGVTPDGIYTQALKDKEGGNFELALTELKDFLRFYPNEDRAPNAQFYIGEIYQYQKDYDNAIAAFDTVLEKYGDNNKTPDAMLLKGKVLMSTDRRPQAAKVFRDLVGKYPNTEAARKAQTYLRVISPGTPAATKKRKSQ